MSNKLPERLASAWVIGDKTERQTGRLMTDHLL